MWRSARLLVAALSVCAAFGAFAQVQVTPSVQGDTVVLTAVNSSSRTHACNGSFGITGSSFGESRSRQQSFTFTVAGNRTVDSVRSETTWSNVQVNGFRVQCFPVGQAAPVPPVTYEPEDRPYNVTVCIGEFERECPKNMMNLKHYGCGISSGDAARDACRSRVHTRPYLMANPHGNHCGYAIYSVTCNKESEPLPTIAPGGDPCLNTATITAVGDAPLPGPAIQQGCNQ
jgi:hypothetical protein